jgi:aspartyl-tRNA(Asn)/glutamyl-tRNA(Gln) amidotransferase subunit A
MTPFSLTIHEAAALLRTHALSSQELTRSVLDHIRATDGQLHSYLTINEDEALQQAREAEQRLSAKSSTSPLCGIPFAIKDVILTKGLRSTAGSKMLDW